MMFGAHENQDYENSAELDARTTEELRSLGYFGDLGSPKAGRRDPKESIDIHVRLEAANRHLVAGQLEMAIDGLWEVLRDDPSNLRGLSDLATAQALSGDLILGVQTLERAISLAPRSAPLRLQLAAFEEERGKSADALASLDKALEIDPGYLEARLEKASYLGKLRRHREAKELLVETLQRFPTHPEVRALYALLVAKEEGENDAAQSRAASQTGSAQNASTAESLHARNRQAMELYRQGKADEAVRQLEMLVAENPRYLPGSINLGWIALARGEWNAAVRHSQRAVAVDPKSALAWSNLGKARQGQGLVGKAEEAYREALELDGGSWQTRLSLATVLVSDGQLEAVLGELRTIETLTEEILEAQFELARFYEVLLQDAATAREHYQAVITMDPDDPLSRVAARKLQELPNP
jgi:tetratricopeptide (TPR) repeat protein